MLYFSLTPQIYAVHFENAVILLDIKNDNYLSLIDDAAKNLTYILKHPFKKNDDGTYKSLDESDDRPFWIQEFLKNNFIQESSEKHRKDIAPDAIIAGGLREYQWDTKVDWKPFQKSSYVAIFKALIVLGRVHRTLRKNKLGGLFDLIRKNNNKTSIHPSQKEIEELAAAVDAASILYFKKTYCLAWATTFCILALKKGWPANLLIGVQTNPFYAHAWAEIDNIVINDDPQVNQVLSIIAQIHEKH